MLEVDATDEAEKGDGSRYRRAGSYGWRERYEPEMAMIVGYREI